MEIFDKYCDTQPIDKNSALACNSQSDSKAIQINENIVSDKSQSPTSTSDKCLNTSDLSYTSICDESQIEPGAYDNDYSASDNVEDNSNTGSAEVKNDKKCKLCSGRPVKTCSSCIYSLEVVPMQLEASCACKNLHQGQKCKNQCISCCARLCAYSKPPESGECTSCRGICEHCSKAGVGSNLERSVNDSCTCVDQKVEHPNNVFKSAILINQESSILEMDNKKKNQVSTCAIQVDNNVSCTGSSSGILEVDHTPILQKSEITLRINATTSDAASQTELDVREESGNSEIGEEQHSMFLVGRRKLIEEIECEKLSEEFMSCLPTAVKLKELLVPGPDMKKPTDYVQNLFITTKKFTTTIPPFKTIENSGSTPQNTLTTTVSSQLPLPSSDQPPSPILSGTSTYFTTSEPKAVFLNRYGRDIDRWEVVKNTNDLREKKEQLITRLDRKLQILRGEYLEINKETKFNDELGVKVEDYVDTVARPYEVAKFRVHVEEIGKITSLLLCLSGRLARVENALGGIEVDHPERGILESKRDKLHDQFDEAKQLKQRIDGRASTVSAMLYKYLSSAQYANYDHFIHMKTKLIVDAKEIADKIQLGEEQLSALREIHI